MKSKSLRFLVLSLLGLVLSFNHSIAQDCSDMLDDLGFVGEQSPIFIKQMESIINITNADIYKDISKKTPAIFACSGANAMSEACQGGQGSQTQILDALTVMKYAADLKTASELNKAQNKKIDDFPSNLDTYTSAIRTKWNDLTEAQKEADGAQDKYDTAVSQTKSAINSAKKLVELETDLANYQIAKATKNLFETDAVPKELKKFIDSYDEAKLKDKVDIAKVDFDTSLKDIATLANYKDEAYSAVQTAFNDLKADSNNISYRDIWSQIDGLADCMDPKVLAKNAKKKAQCQKNAGRYLANLVAGGEKASQYNISTDEGCEFFDKNQGLFKAIAGPGGFLSQLAAIKYSKYEYNLGAGDERCIKLGTTLARAFGDPHKQAALYYPDPSERVTINPQFIGGDAGPASLALGGSPEFANPFSSYTSNQTTPAFVPTGEGLVSNIGGSDNTLNSSSASNMYTNLASQISDTASGAGNFVNKYASTSNKFSNYNSNLNSGIASTAITPNMYIERANSAQSILDLASGAGPRYDQNQVYDSIDLRQKIAVLNAQKSKLVEDLANNYQYINESQYLAQAEYANKWLSTSEKANFILKSTLAKGSVDYTKMQLAAIDREINLIYSNTRPVLYNSGYVWTYFDTSLMFAANSKKLPAKRSLKLSKVKTPIKVRYELKEGWQNEFKKYIAEMKKKAVEAKKNLNANKSKLKKLLAQKLPTLDTKDMPAFARVDYERHNMYALRETAQKNIAIIDKAMAYHRNKRSITPPSIYKQYEKESAELKSSMQKFVKAVDDADPKIVKAGTVLTQLQLERPRAEVLRAVAKSMVERGL
jgi:hypothetical protein